MASVVHVMTTTRARNLSPAISQRSNVDMWRPPVPGEIWPNLDSAAAASKTKIAFASPPTTEGRARRPAREDAASGRRGRSRGVAGKGTGDNREQVRAGPLSFRVQRLAADAHRLGADQHESDRTGFLAMVDPVVNGAALHQHVAGLEVHGLAVVELHVDLTRHHHRVVDRIGAVHARAVAGLEAQHAEYRAVVDGGADLAARRIFAAVVVDRETGGRPDDGGLRARPVGDDVLG